MLKFCLLGALLGTAIGIGGLFLVLVFGPDIVADWCPDVTGKATA